ncbi:hypothetical protein F3Y22_tig00110893pilonHSYRG00427 [Hibiscus syriacus]|uniref:FATC domain-containing protein n=1 Tax=Hibiscus syriacus TaxID=106335 RepID=A0A6A2ZGQ8_HIBSY|nr:hypothetical protein F3Y22_tig00110893pilonHSYRG00427 [Hibiscus syriacus]
MMQGLHHHQHQFAALLFAALPKNTAAAAATASVATSYSATASTSVPTTTTPLLYPFKCDLQSTVLAMRDCAYEASVALSAFARVSRGHTALTSESGSMLEDANAILLPLESVLSKDVSAMARERETKMEVSPIHGQAIYQSYGLRDRETCQTFKPLLPSLTFSVKELHSLLTRLARTASLHAGNLHKALEGLGESQEVKSKSISLSRPELVTSDATEYDERGGESISTSSGGSPKELVGLTGLSLHDKEWISPPDSIDTSSVESSITSTETSLSDGINDLAETMKISLDSSQNKANDDLNLVPSSQSKYDEISHRGPENVYQRGVSDESVSNPLESSQPSNRVNLDVKFQSKDEVSTLGKVEVDDESHEVPVPSTDRASRLARGKNSYAMSVLRRVEMKLDGRDITDRRKLSIAEQVDYLLKQATSVDNLCSVYEAFNREALTQRSHRNDGNFRHIKNEKKKPGSPLQNEPESSHSTCSSPVSQYISDRRCYSIKCGWPCFRFPLPPPYQPPMTLRQHQTSFRWELR